MQLFGVCNASPDSLNADSIVVDAASAQLRINDLLAHGCFAFDVGGQGSTFAAEEVDPEREWQRLNEVLPTFVATGCPVSVDTWRPSVARRALELGVTWLNAADGLQEDAMFEVAAEFNCPIVLPFIHGPDPLRLTHIPNGYDPVKVIVEWFEAQLMRADHYGVRANCIVDPGTGFAPHNWAWDDRFLYQKEVYSRLNELRVFDLPLYIALPWKETAQHAELLDIVIGHDPEYGRAHYPQRIRAAEENYARLP
jgi:dihydropteroate synthase